MTSRARGRKSNQTQHSETLGSPSVDTTHYLSAFLNVFWLPMLRSGCRGAAAWSRKWITTTNRTELSGSHSMTYFLLQHLFDLSWQSSQLLSAHVSELWSRWRAAPLNAQSVRGRRAASITRPSQNKRPSDDTSGARLQTSHFFSFILKKGFPSFPK